MNLKNGIPFVPFYQRFVPYLPGLAPIRSASAAMGPMATSSFSSYPYAVMVPQTIGGSYYISGFAPTSSTYLPVTTPGNPFHLQMSSPSMHPLTGIDLGGANLIITGSEATSISDDEVHTISRKPVMYNADSEQMNIVDDVILESNLSRVLPNSNSLLVPSLVTDTNFTQMANSGAHSNELVVSTTSSLTTSSVISTSICQDNYTSDYHSDTSVSQCDFVSPESDASGRGSELSSMSGISKGDCGTALSLLPMTTGSLELQSNEKYAQQTDNIIVCNWKRDIENNDKVIYVSPDGARLDSLDAVYAWQENRINFTSTNPSSLCPCGREILSLAQLKDIFHFNKEVSIECDDVTMTRSQSFCLHVFNAKRRMLTNDDDVNSKKEDLLDAIDEAISKSLTTKVTSSSSSSCLKRQASCSPTPIDAVNCNLTDVTTHHLQAKRFCDDAAKNQPVTKCSTPTQEPNAESIEYDVQALHDYLTAQELAMAREAAEDRQLNEEKSGGGVDMEISSEFGREFGHASPSCGGGLSSAAQSPESRLIVEGQGITWASVPSATDSVPITSLSAAAFFHPTDPTQITWMAAAAAPTATISNSSFAPFVNYYNPFAASSAAVASPYIPWIDYNCAQLYTPNFIMSTAAAAPTPHPHAYISAAQFNQAQTLAVAAAQVQMQMQAQAQLQAQYVAMAAAAAASATTTCTTPASSCEGCGGSGEPALLSTTSSSLMTPNK